MDAPYIKFCIDIMDAYRYQVHRLIRDTGYLGPLMERPLRIEDETSVYYADQGWQSLEGMVENTTSGWDALREVRKALQEHSQIDIYAEGMFFMYEWPRPEGAAASLSLGEE